MGNRTYHPRGIHVDGFNVREHPLYATWSGILSRCTNPNAPAWDRYGGRGIAVCPTWHHFMNFVQDMGPKPTPLHTIERLDNELGYNKSNCIWATSTEQNHNRRQFRNNTSGETGVVDVSVSLPAYEARFDHEKTRYRIGIFGSIAEAANARTEFIELFYRDRCAAIALVSAETLWRTSTTGTRGVTPHKGGGFIARATVCGQRRYLGYFTTQEKAEQVIEEFKAEAKKYGQAADLFI